MDKRATGEIVLKEKYTELPDSPEVTAAVEGYKQRNKVDIAYKPIDRISIYLTRLDEIVHDNNLPRREHALGVLKKDLYRHTIIKPGNISESYWENQRESFKKMEGISWDKFKEQKTESILASQKESLGIWFDQLSAADSPYPLWIRYWAIRSVVGMGTYDKHRHVFARREEDTVSPFPELNEEALSHVLNIINQKYPESINTSKMGEAGFRSFLQLESFSKLYASAIEQLRPTESKGVLKNTQGGWALFTAESDPVKFEPNIIVEGKPGTYKGRPLVPSTQGTGWCVTTAITASAELANGEIHVFYSLDKNGEPMIPRAAIRTVKGRMVEVSGLSKYQNLDPYILDEVEKKLSTFGEEGKKFGEKRIRDTRILNTIVAKSEKREALTNDEIAFLNKPSNEIYGFGNRLDPRFQEMRKFFSIES